MAKKADYKPLIEMAVHELKTFEPEESECSWVTHGKSFAIITPKAGTIEFKIDEDDNARGEPASVTLFAKFDNPLAARALGFDCNQFSGKWNHHFLWSRSHITSVFAELRNRAF